MNQKRVVAFVFLSLLLFSFVADFVSAQTFWQKLFGTGSSSSVVWDPVKDMFTSWQRGELSLNIAKYLFWALLTIFLYSVVGFIPGIKALHGSAKFLFVLIIGFLATAYITPSDVYTALAGYSAMGLVLSALLPLIILLFFSVEISKESSEGGAGVGGRIISKFMWLVFIMFLVWKLIDGMFGFTIPDGQKVISLVEGWIYIGVIAFSVLWLLFLEKQFLKMLFKAEGKVFISSVGHKRLNDARAQLARVNQLLSPLEDVSERGDDGQSQTKRGLLKQKDNLEKSIARMERELPQNDVS